MTVSVSTPGGLAGRGPAGRGGHPAVVGGGPPWAPYSPCAVDCLASEAAAVGAPLAAFRLIVAAFTVLAVILIAAAYPFLGASSRSRVIRRWCQTLLWTFGVRISTDQAEPARSGPALVVANHISWLDVLVLGVVSPGRMVARADLRGWPVLGPIAARAGTIFVDRARLSRLPDTVAEVSSALRSGASVLAFPEGTTWCGAAAGRFRPALFQAAIDAGVPVEPVSVGYLVGGRPSTVAAFVGEDPLLVSFWRVARASGLVAEARRHPPLAPDTDRRTLARRAGALVHRL